MVLFNYSTKELTAKIVYYGPGLCGKTTNLQYVFENLPANIHKGKMLSLATKTDRTLFFDFLPIELGTIRGMRTRLQLYTVPGQVFYNTTRKLVLKGADGLVFVADSQRKMIDANVESFRNLEQNLLEHDIRLSEMPHIIQFNKRDLPEIASVEELNAALNKHNAPIYEAVATTGIGVQETLKAVTRLVLNSLKEKYGHARRAAEREPAAVLPVAAAARSDQAPAPAPPPPVPAAQARDDVLDVAPEPAAEPVIEITASMIDEPPRPRMEEQVLAADPVVELSPNEPALAVEPEEPVLSIDIGEEEPPPVVAEAADEESPLEIDEDLEGEADAAPVAVTAAPAETLLETPLEPVLEGPAPSELPIEEPIGAALEIEEEPGEGFGGEEPRVEPLPIAAAEPFEVETASVDPRGRMSAPFPESFTQRMEQPGPAATTSISVETRAIALGGATPVEAREATFPIAVDVQGQTLHIMLTVTVRVEKS